MVIYYFVANEGLSIIENLAEAGLPIPQFINDALLNLQKDKSNKKVKVVKLKKKGQKYWDTNKFVNSTLAKWVEKKDGA